MQTIEKPWGREEIWALTDKYVGKYLIIKAGHKLSFQFHRKKIETIRLLEGLMELELAEGGQRKSINMNPGDVYHIDAGVGHRMSAIKNCVVLEVSTPELDDIVRIEDDYGRIP